MIDEINHIVDDTARSLGFMIYESSALLRGENTKIAVKIDKKGVISHNDCEAFSRELSRRLDEAGVLPNYSLEVSSPGFKRKLRNSQEFRRFVDAPVKVTALIDGANRVFKGILKEAGEKGVTISAEGKESIVDYESITQANLDY
jgi:ribosome maturation factor RimP